MQVKCYTNIQRQRLTFAQKSTTGKTDASYIRFTRGYIQQWTDKKTNIII